MRVMLSLTPARRTLLARAVGRRPALGHGAAGGRRLLLDAQRACKRRLCTQSEAQLEYASSCWLPTTWVNLPLVSRHEASHDATLYKFGLPEGQSLNLPVCGCLLLRGPSDVVRPYTPVSDNSMLGGFELLVKRYPSGMVSQYLHGLAVSDEVGFKHIKFNVKEQYPFEGKKTVSMVCGGTGLTPMYQALLKLLNTPGDERQVVLLYGSKTIDDILMREQLDAWASQHANRFKLVHVLGGSPGDSAPADAGTSGLVEGGWIDSNEYAMDSFVLAKIEKHLFPAAPDTTVFVCGPPAMYETLCGERGKPLAEGSVFQKLGYTSDMVVKM